MDEAPADLIDLLHGLTEQEVLDLVEDLPAAVIGPLLAQTSKAPTALPPTPFDQAREIDPGYLDRAHLTYLSERLAEAIKDVEAGQSRYLVVSMPPRSGKSLLTSVYLPTWLLRSHPDWKIGLISHAPTLAVSWGRQVRRMVEEHKDLLGLTLAKDAGAASEWQTTVGGGITSRSAPGQSITGLGFKVMLIDDAVKDFAAAHSETQREALWDWWLANAQTRLEPPALVVVVGTRWHEDDLIGRILSPEHEGDPGDWEVIEFPAIATEHDVLGREPGDPLYSPLLEESREEALTRWDGLRRSLGTYTWSALYQQSPAPSKGAIFDTGWWRFWTDNPEKGDRLEDGTPDPDGKVIYFRPEDHPHGRWLDSWDMAFKGTDASDYVVGQRWARQGVGRYLVGSSRARRTFTSTLAKVKEWADPTTVLPRCSAYVHERLVEDKANGTAIIDTLKREISGLIPVNPTESKQARARAVTPEVEAGNVFLPLPSDPGNEWVADLLDELRNFPTGAHDDQVDALTQALSRLRDAGQGSITVPGRVTALPTQRRATTALSQRRISR